MKSSTGIIVAVIVVVLIVGGIVFGNFNKKPPTLTNLNSTITMVQSVTTVSTAQDTKPAVPTPTEEDVIRTFFNLINEHRVEGAVSMLDESTVKDDSQKQAWGVEFNAFSKVSIVSLSPTLQEDWTDVQHEYKVVLDVTMKPESANAVIPYYGFDNGQNYRWITINKVGALWKILGIATGP
jgi:hypothetical protein